MTEELREVSYIDQIKLMALDHPAGTEIVTNEKFKSPPFPEFRLYGGTHRVYPTAARDSHGADVRAALLKRDQRYPDDFQRDMPAWPNCTRWISISPARRARWQGDAGAARLGGLGRRQHVPQRHAGASRSGVPYLQVKDAQGNWKTVIEDMGMPSGKPKPMAVDLTGKFLSASREVRIVTSLCVYWDEIYLFENNAPPRRASPRSP
jgi:hypothetical protein